MKILFDAEIHHGRAEDMAGIGKQEFDGVFDGEPFAIRYRLELPKGNRYIGKRIQWFKRRFSLALSTFVDETRIAFLNVGRIFEHNAAQVECSRRAVNFTAKTLLNKHRDEARMIDVGMRKNEVIDRCWVETKMPVEFIGFEAHALKHATIEQNTFALFKCEQVLGTGYGTGGAVKRKLHIRGNKIVVGEGMSIYLN